MHPASIGRYRLDAEVGSGRTGTVYKAYDTDLRRTVALKVFHVDLVPTGQLKREAEALATLNHPSIVQFYDAEYISGRPVLAMEWVDGVTLRRLMRSANGVIPVADALRITARLLEALSYAHSRDMVHRDLKPLNILLGVGGTVKLADFGGAEMVGPNQYVTGGGTFAYMAPEDLGETPRSDARSDLWSVGVILYEMLAGRLPFSGLNLKDPIAMAQGLGTMAADPLPPGLPGSDVLRTVIGGALRPVKGSRYQDAAEFRCWVADAARQLQVSLDVPLEADIGAVMAADGVGRPSGDAAPEEGTVLEGAVRQAQGEADEGATVLEVGQAVPGGAPAIAASGAAPVPATGPARADGAVASAVAVPESIHFGSVRLRAAARATIVLRADGDGLWPVGTVTHVPDWLHVSGGSQRGRRQRYSLRLATADLEALGEYRDEVVIETASSRVRVPVAVQVLPPLRQFAQVADWFVLVLILVALPVVIGLVTRHPAGGGLVTALLASVLARAIAEGDMGPAEQLSCKALVATGLCTCGLALGLLAAGWSNGHPAESTAAQLLLAASAGSVGAALLWMQGLYPRRWDRWAAATGIASGVAVVVMVVLAVSRL